MWLEELLGSWAALSGISTMETCASVLQGQGLAPEIREISVWVALI